MDRREFIALAGAALVLPPLSASGAVVLFDARHADSIAHAAELGRHGAIALATSQDVVRLWYESRALRAAREIGGLTPHSDFEVLRSLLRDERKALRASRVRQSGALTSWHFA